MPIVSARSTNVVDIYIRIKSWRLFWATSFNFRNLEGRVVVNLSCSTLVRRIAEALGCRVTVKPVGFKYIAAEMKKGGVLMGGEEAGGIGIAAHMPERDGILACLIL